MSQLPDDRHVLQTEDGFSNPLEGIHVLDLSHVQAGPICGMMLADMGAEVIKVEALSGDMYRHPIEGAYFQNFNRNKRDIALDLKSAEGRQIALKLAERADILLENYLPGALQRLGLGYETVREANPSIIYGSISGFGQTGPWRTRPAFDPIVQAISGCMDATGEPGRPPVRTRAAMIDYCSGTTMAFAIAAALVRRARTGAGEHIDIALMDIALYAMSPYVTHFRKRGKVFPRTGSAHPAVVPNQNFKVCDGYIYIAATSDQMWENLCRVLHLEQIGADSRFKSRALRTQNSAVLIKAISPAIEALEGRELEAQLLEAGVPCGRVRSVAELFDDAYIETRGMLEQSIHPDLGVLETFKTPIRLSGKSSPLRNRAPLLGEHTDEILLELGYSTEKIEEMLTKGVIMGPLGTAKSGKPAP